MQLALRGSGPGPAVPYPSHNHQALLTEPSARRLFALAERRRPARIVLNGVPSWDRRRSGHSRRATQAAQRAACSMQRVTRSVQRDTCTLQETRCNRQHNRKASMPDDDRRRISHERRPCNMHRCTQQTTSTPLAMGRASVHADFSDLPGFMISADSGDDGTQCGRPHNNT